MLRVFHDLVVNAWMGVSLLIHVSSAPLRGQTITIVYSPEEAEDAEEENGTTTTIAAEDAV